MKLQLSIVLKMVWNCLSNDEIMIIGVYGKSGVGKSAITKEINDRLVEQAERFDKIIWVIVSQNADVYKLQREIGAALDLIYLAIKTTQKEQDCC